MIFSDAMLEQIRDEIWCNGKLEDAKAVKIARQSLGLAKELLHCKQCYGYYERHEWPHYAWCELCGEHTEMLVGEIDRLRAELERERLKNSELRTKVHTEKREAAE